MRLIGTASILFAAVVLYLQMHASPVAERGVPSVDLVAVVEEMGRDLTYEYELITGEELAGCEVQWEADLPYGIRAMLGLGEGNILIVSNSRYAIPECIRPFGHPSDEEMLSIYGPDGMIIHRRLLGSWRVLVLRSYTSPDGKLVSLYTCWDHDCRMSVIDHRGRECFSIEGGVTVELFPSSEGDYLVCSRPYGAEGKIFIDAFQPTGERYPVEVGSFMRADGSRLVDAVAEELNNEWGQVIWADDGNLLYTWRVADTSGVACRYQNALALLDMKTSASVWETIIPSTSYQPVVASGKPGERYILLDHHANDEGISHTVIEAASGRTVGMIAGRLPGGRLWSAIGAEGGSFYANASGLLKMDRGGFRSFLVKCSPQLEVVRHGLLYDGYGLQEKKESGGYVWGIHRPCTLDGRCYPVVTAIYDMRGEALPGADVLSTRVKPVLLEGYWFITEMTEDQVVLVGQVDPRGGALQKVTMDRSWIDREGR